MISHDRLIKRFQDLNTATERNARVSCWWDCYRAGMRDRRTMRMLNMNRAILRADKVWFNNYYVDR